jgi:hypothetical protein
MNESCATTDVLQDTENNSLFPPVVSISALKNPDWRPLARLQTVRQVFEQKKAMAPAAQLKFRLSRLQQDNHAQPLELRLRGDDHSVQVPLDQNLLFSIADVRDEDQGLNELVLNRPKKSYSWLPFVRSPNLSQHQLRMGDIRLECELRFAMERDDMSFTERAFFAAMGGYCGSERIHFYYRVNQPVNTIVLRYATRELILKSPYVTEDGKSFRLPEADQSWPDDTLIELVPR